MLHPLFPTNVTIPDSDSSEGAPAAIDTTVQGPSVADFGAMCNNESICSNDALELVEFKTFSRKSKIEVCTSEEDLTRAIHYYNECCDREDAALSAMLVEGGTLSLSCSKSTSDVFSPRRAPRDKRRLRVKVETRIQCPSRTDHSSMATASDSDRCLLGSVCSLCSEDRLKNVCSIRSCDSGQNICSPRSYQERQLDNACDGSQLSRKSSYIHTSGQATSNTAFDVLKESKNTSIERKSSLKKTTLKKKSSLKKLPDDDECHCHELRSPVGTDTEDDCKIAPKHHRPKLTDSHTRLARTVAAGYDSDCDYHNSRSKSKKADSRRHGTKSPSPTCSDPPSPRRIGPKKGEERHHSERGKNPYECTLCGSDLRLSKKDFNSKKTPDRKQCEPCVKPEPKQLKKRDPCEERPPPEKALCEPCEPCVVCEPSTAPPVYEVPTKRQVLVPDVVKIECAPQQSKPATDHISVNPNSCCNLCCQEKSEQVDITGPPPWMQPTAGGFGCNPPYSEKLSESKGGAQNCKNRRLLWGLLIALGIIAAVAGFGAGYLIGSSKGKGAKRKMEQLGSQKSDEKPNYAYEETAIEKPELAIHSEARSNRSNRRYMPTVMPYVQMPFVPNTSWPQPKWTWRCVDKRCQRLPAKINIPLRSLHTCNMLCDTAKLWPKPTVSMSLATAVVPVRADGFSLEVLSAPSEIVRQHLTFAFQLLQADLVALEKNLTNPQETELGPPRSVLVRVAVKGNADVRMQISTDESYRLSTSNTGDLLTADIRASSFCGARHAFETLSQIVWAEPAGATLLALEAVDIKDTPRFQYRGLLLDTSQNFLNVTDILRTIDAMGASKLNTFHWHVSDSQSFPLRLNAVPRLAEYGSYGPNFVYTTDDVRAVVRRARLRGIRVILEVDLPTAGRAWTWSNETDLGILAFCIDAQPWEKFCNVPPCGYLNPSNSHVYELLEKIYREIIELTGVDDVFHLGWSGSPQKCWEYHLKNVDSMGLWSEFTRQALAALKRANKGKKPQHTIVWSPLMNDVSFLSWLSSEDITVEVWNDTYLEDIKKHNVRTVLSPWDKYHLDCRHFVNCSQSVMSWQEMYEYRPWSSESSRVLGSEVCLWNQHVDLDKHLWPKGMVLAERLWSDPATKADSEVYLRLDIHRSRQLTRGTESGPIWHAWCTHNPHDCVLPQNNT